VRLVSSVQPPTPLLVALRRAQGAALYLENAYPGIAERVGAIIDVVPADRPWTVREWMAFSILVRRACRDLPFSESDNHADHAIWTLRRQLARALVAAHQELNPSAGPRSAD
jgi:hypothetical protein